MDAGRVLRHRERQISISTKYDFETLILGTCSCFLEGGKKHLKEIIYSKLWFTYRKNFRAIGAHHYVKC